MITARPPNAPFTSEICIGPVSSNYKFRNSNLCVHLISITKYVQLKIKDGGVPEIECPRLNCGQLLDPLCCRTVIPPKALDKWCDLLCERALLGLDWCYCPNRRCSAVVVRRLVCPNCKRQFCFFCKLPWHAGYWCEESGKPIDMNDVAFEVLAERKKWMRCPHCHHCVELIDGCSVLQMWEQSFCYKCGGNVHRQPRYLPP